MTSAPRSLLILQNLRASRSSSRALAALLDALERRGIAAVIVSARERQAAAARANVILQGANKPGAILAAGGDSTAGFAAGLASRYGLPLAVAPWGVGDYLASELAIPAAPRALADLIAKGSTRPIALGRANGAGFTLMAGVGLDAEAVGAIAPTLKSLSGRLAYGAALAKSVARWRPAALDIELDGVAYAASWFIATNARFRPSRLRHAGDGPPRLTGLLLSANSLAARIEIAERLALRRIEETPRIRVVPFTRARIDADRALPVQLDGEIIAATPLEITVEEIPLRVFAP